MSVRPFDIHRIDQPDLTDATTRVRQPIDSSDRHVLNRSAPGFQTDQSDVHSATARVHSATARVHSATARVHSATARVHSATGRVHTTARVMAACLLLAVAAALHAQPVSAQPVSAQPVSAPMGQGGEGWRMLVGVSGGMMFTSHAGTVTTSDGTYPCCAFTDGSGSGPAFAGQGVFVLTGALRLIGRLTFERRDGMFDGREYSYPVNTGGQTLTDAVFVDRLEARLGVMSVEALAAWEETATGIHIAAGPSFGFIVSESYAQTQRIVSPTSIVFLDNSRERLLFDDARSYAKSPMVSLRMLAGIIRPIAQGVFFTGDVSYALPLTSMGRAMSWKNGGLGITAGVLVGV